MNTVKKLPLAMAVVAALCPISVMAQEFTQEQIDAIVAKAVDKAGRPPGKNRRRGQQKGRRDY